MYHLIYKTTCLITGHYYIGRHSTKNLNDGYIGSGVKLKALISEYGIDKFKCIILEEHIDKDSVKLRERELVSIKILSDPLCLNMIPGGGGQGPLSPETKAKISAKHTGRKHTDEAKQRMSDGQKGKKHSIETIEKMSKVHKGNKYCLGNVVTDEVRMKISSSMTGLKKSEETKKKMAEAARLREAKKRQLKNCDTITIIINEEN